MVGTDPLTIQQRLCQRLFKVRRKILLKGFVQMAKSQVTVEYEDDLPKRIHSVFIAAQHDEDKDVKVIK